MRRLHIFLLTVFMCLLTTAAITQAQEGLRQDAKGRYLFTHVASAADVPKAVIYDRLKSFILEDLNASDTYIQWDEAGRDSVSTISYIILDNSPEMQNQIIDCKARLDFTDGQVSLRMNDFIYRGTRAGSDVEYNQPLHRMAAMPDAARSWAMTALAEILRQLMARMDHLAAGKR